MEDFIKAGLLIERAVILALEHTGGDREAAAVWLFESQSESPLLKPASLDRWRKVVTKVVEHRGVGGLL